jgi:hypothetical protein
VQKTLINSLKFRNADDFDRQKLRSDKSTALYSENFLKEELFTNLRTRFLAIAIFLYYFIESGTIGIVPEKAYVLYRNIRISDVILYGLIIYSFFNYREFKDLFKSRSFLIAKLILFYILFEFAVSAVRYGFNPIEYFLRLKGIWASFLVFPFMLLIKRNGMGFLIKIIFPVSLLSNFLYILTALTGIPFLPDVSIITQRLPGGIEVFRVFGGTFFGEVFYLGIIYYWITKRFRLWQMILIFIFIIPHILAFGRLAWVNAAFTITLMITMNSLNKRSFKILFRQAVIIIIMAICLMVSFMKVIPESDFYFDALNARLFQGQEDIKYGEGTYGTRIILQNDALINLWMNNDILLGIGMHPMWVVKPESREEAVYYSAFCDVTWPSVLAAYGLIGFLLACILQVYYGLLSFKLLKRNKEINLYSLMLTFLLAKLIFDSTIGFSYILLSTGLWGLMLSMNIYVPILVYVYEEQRKQGTI